MKRIHKGRRDFLILALFDGLISAKKYGFASEITPLPKNEAQLPVHFLISKKSTCRGLTKRINSILTALKVTNFIKSLEEKYLRQLD